MNVLKVSILIWLVWLLFVSMTGYSIFRSGMFNLFWVWQWLFIGILSVLNTTATYLVWQLSKHKKGAKTT